MEHTDIIPWQPNDEIPLPRNASTATAIAPYAKQLRASDVRKVVTAFDAGLFDLAIDYVWKRTMAILKHELGLMGMAFVGEMLARPDIHDESPVELVVTDYEAIQLGYQLGVINRVGSIELRHGAELLSYYSSPNLLDGDEIDQLQALGLLRSCVVHILSRDRIEASLNFKEFRTRLTQTVLGQDDPDVVALANSAYFFRRTTLRILLGEAKTAKGAQQENALANLNTIVVRSWKSLQDPDRWQVGQSYAEASSNNLKILSSSLRRLLMTVQGFDYVPETLRSGTYTRLAKAVLSAHEQMNNYVNEVAPMKELASIGSTIPGPALQTCMQATLAVKLGNYYGYSYDAEQHADTLLRSLGVDRWTQYLSKFLPTDEMLLRKMTSERPAIRFAEVINKYPYDPANIRNMEMSHLLKAAGKNDAGAVQNRARNLVREMGLDDT